MKKWIGGLIAIMMFISGFAFYKFRLEKTELDLESLITYQISGDDGNVQIDIELKKTDSQRLNNVLSEVIFDTESLRFSKMNSTVDVNYTISDKVLNDNRVKLTHSDFVYPIEIGPLNYYILNESQVTDLVLNDVLKIYSEKIDEENELVTSTLLSCEACVNPIIEQVESPIILDSEIIKDGEADLILAHLIKSNIHVNIGGVSTVFRAYYYAFAIDVYYNADHTINANQSDSFIVYMKDLGVDYVNELSDEQVISNFRTFINEKLK